MSNIFRPVSDNIILPDKIYQGQSWRNISFGSNATVEEYGQHGLYLEVGVKPIYTSIQNISSVIETIDHTLKQILLTWDVTDKLAEEVSVILEKEAKLSERKDEIVASPISDVTFDQVEAWIDNTVVDLDSAKIALKKLARYVLART